MNMQHSLLKNWIPPTTAADFLQKLHKFEKYACYISNIRLFITVPMEVM